MLMNFISWQLQKNAFKSTYNILNQHIKGPRKLFYTTIYYFNSYLKLLNIRLFKLIDLSLIFKGLFLLFYTRFIQILQIAFNVDIIQLRLQYFLINLHQMLSFPNHYSLTHFQFNWMFCIPSVYQSQQTHVNKRRNQPISFSPILISQPLCFFNAQNRQLFLHPKAEKKTSKTLKMENEDKDQYKPGHLSQKKTRKNIQNENRNIIPNIVNQILSFVQKSTKSGTVIQKIFTSLKFSPSWTVKRFFLYQKMLKNKTSHYVNQQTLKIFTETTNVDTLVYSEDQQNFYNKVSRVLIMHFLRTEADISTLTSKRMQNSKKALHIKIQHELRLRLQKMYRQSKQK